MHCLLASLPHCYCSSTDFHRFSQIALPKADRPSSAGVAKVFLQKKSPMGSLEPAMPYSRSQRLDHYNCDTISDVCSAWIIFLFSFLCSSHYTTNSQIATSILCHYLPALCCSFYPFLSLSLSLSLSLLDQFSRITVTRPISQATLGQGSTWMGDRPSSAGVAKVFLQKKKKVTHGEPWTGHPLLMTTSAWPLHHCGRVRNLLFIQNQTFLFFPDLLSLYYQLSNCYQYIMSLPSSSLFLLLTGAYFDIWLQSILLKNGQELSLSL